MRCYLFSLILFCLNLFITVSADADGRVGNGGEYITHENNPWFIGEEPVTYCIMPVIDFSLSLPEVERLVAESLSDWSRTIEELNPNRLPTSFGALAGKTLSTNFQATSCNNETDLTFYFGNIDERVRLRMSPYADHLIGFAFRDAYEPTTGRGKGFVWITPDRGPLKYKGPRWRDSDFWLPSSQPGLSALRPVLDHEIGHVLGFDHSTPGFLNTMDPTLPAYIVSFGPFWRPQLHKYLLDNWLISGKRLCSSIERMFARPMREYLNIPENGHEPFSVCFQTLKDNDHIYTKLWLRDPDIEFSSQSKSMYFYGTTTLKPLVSGKYLKQQQFTSFDFLQVGQFHDNEFFINGKNFKFLARNTDLLYTSEGRFFSLQLLKQGDFELRRLRLGYSGKQWLEDAE